MSLSFLVVRDPASQAAAAGVKGGFVFINQEMAGCYNPLYLIGFLVEVSFCFRA